MAKTVAVILADGFEEVEAITPIDVLRRAELSVTVVGLGGRAITGAHGVKINADISLDEYKEIPDAVVLPGGMPGAQNLKESKRVAELIQKVHAAQNVVGAICAAPALVLTPAGILDRKRATCYPGFEKNFTPSITFSRDRVVEDGNVITSRGPGTALEFALALVEKLAGKEKASALKEGLLAKV